MRPIVCLVGVLLGSAPTIAQVSPVPVALSDTLSPAGSVYTSFGTPVVNNAGQVAFHGNLIGGSSPQGVFVGTPGSVQIVALQGSAAPAGGNYGNFASQPVVLNGLGQVAFYSELSGGSSPGGSFMGAPGSVQPVALLGTSAPAGGNFLSTGTPAINGLGQAAVGASLINGETTAEGLFAGAPGALQTIAVRGGMSPTGNTYFYINSSAINGSGQVAFQSVLSTGMSANFVGTPGAIQTAALEGTLAPGGGNYGLLNVPTVNSSGQVAFRAGLTGPGAANGIFAGAPGSVQAVARQLQLAPGGGAFSDFNNPSINSSGEVAFIASLTGGPSTQGIYVGAPGAIQAAALQGSAAPGGGTFSSFSSQYVAINSSGQLAFIGTTTVRGLYAGSPGSLSRVVAEGQLVDVDPGPGSVFRQVAINGLEFITQSSGDDGKGLSFTDTGFITFRLTFTDGTSGVFITQIAPVPEPGCVGLVSICGLIAVGWASRRTVRCRLPITRLGANIPKKSLIQ
jgi:hypothetical protein